MNKKLLTTAVLAATASAAHAQSSVTLYGVIDAGISYVNHSSTTNGGATNKNFKYDDGVAQGSRWGIKGTEDLGSGLKAIFVLENGFNSGNGTLGQGGAMFGRQAFVGLSKNDMGTVTFGRQYSFSTDVLANYSTGGNTVAGNYAFHSSDIDQLTSSRINNSVKYQSANYYGLTFGGMYGFSNQAGAFAGSTTSGSSRAYSFGANYANGPFSLGAAYTNIAFPGSATPSLSPSLGIPGNVGTLRDLRTFGVGGRYVYGPATAWLLWTNTSLSAINSNGTKYNAYEAGVKYALTPALSGALGYTYTSARQGNGSFHWNQVDGAVDYALSKRTDVYALAIYQQASGRGAEALIGSSSSAYFGYSGSGSKNQVAARIGIRHKF